MLGYFTLGWNAPQIPMKVETESLSHKRPVLRIRVSIV